MSTSTANGRLKPYEIPLIGHLPATDFIGRQVRVDINNQSNYYKLLSVDSDKYVTIEVHYKGARKTLRVAAADVGPNWTRNPDLKAKSQQIQQESEKPRFNALANAFDDARSTSEPEEVKLSVLAEPSACVKTTPAPVPPPVAVVVPVLPPVASLPVAESTAPEPAAPAPPVSRFRKLLSFQAPLDTDFAWTDDMKALRKALTDYDELIQLIQDAEDTVASATAVVEAAGVTLVWDGAEAPRPAPASKSPVRDLEVASYIRRPPPPIPAELLRKTTSEERRIAEEWVAGPGKKLREFTSHEATQYAGLAVTRGMGKMMAARLSKAGYQSRYRDESRHTKLYSWKNK